MTADYEKPKAKLILNVTGDTCSENIDNETN
jgi:hypothetical protein